MNEYRNIRYEVRNEGGSWAYEIPPNPLWNHRVAVGGFGSASAAEKAAQQTINDWYVSAL